MENDSERLLFITPQGHNVYCTPEISEKISQALIEADIRGNDISMEAARYFVHPEHSAEGFLKHLVSLGPCDCLPPYTHLVYPGDGKPPYHPTKAECERSKAFLGFDTIIAEVE